MTPLRAAAWTVLFAVVGCSNETLLEDPLPPASIPAEVADALTAGRTSTVVVQLDDRALSRELAEARGIVDQATLLELRASRVRDLTDALLADLPLGARATRVYQYLPAVALELDDLPTAELVAAMVAAMEANRGLEPSLAQSLAQIGQPTAALSGYTGAGTAVAVIDTGANWATADLGACTAVGAPAGTCRVVYAQDFAPEDGVLDSMGHGTNVSAIVAGVAPGTDIVALDVFSSDGLAYTTDILEALDWVVGNQATYNIAAVNMSLGGGSYSAPCADIFGTAIDAVRAAGVAVAVASGNNAYTSSIATPACNAGSFSVGAVYDANLGGVGWSGCTDATSALDKVTCFSNAASFLDILAPGALITAGGYTMGGTSMASPHVAGALAVLRAAYPDDTPDELQAQLTSTGVSITDTRNGLSFPRLDLAAAVADVPAPADSAAPTGTVTVNAGALATASTASTLTLAATDDSGTVTEMCVSSTTACTAWQSYKTSLAWTLAVGDGTKTVYAKFRDAAANVSAQVSDTILVDTVKPLGGTVSATGADSALNVTWSGFTDANGVASYKLVYGTTSPASCTAGTLAYSGTATSTTVTGLANGVKYYLRACAVDAAGNVSLGVTTSQTVAAELVAPTGTILLNNGALWTNNRILSVALSATDASGVTSMCISGGTTCTTWVPYATSTTYGATTTVGLKTVYAKFKDVYGNISGSVSDNVSYEAVLPKNGTVTGTAGTQQVALTWSGYSDVNSGIASYTVVYGTTSPATCLAGTTAYTGTALTTTVTGLTTGTAYTFRVCAVDKAGNVSTGTTVVKTAL